MTENTKANGNGYDGIGFRWTPLAIVVALAAFFGGAYLLSDTVQAEAGRAAGVLADGDLRAVRDYIRSFGVWAPVVSLLLMVAQAVAAPVPSFVVVFANGLAFGIAWGWAISLAVQVLAAAVCFWLARGLGRGPVTAAVGRFGLESADRWFARWGAHAVLVTRLVPGMAFDSVSYAAGLTRMRFSRFITATLIGTAPSTLLYVYLGQRAPQVGWLLLAATLLLTAAFALPVVLRSRRARNEAKVPRPASWMTKRELLVESRLHLAVLALAGLWVYLLVGQLVAPAFTDYWGYLMVQIPVVLAVVLALSRWLGASGGLAWPSHLLAVTAVYADTFGNVAGLYERHAAYDKLLHTIGPAAIAAVAYDIYAARLPRSAPGIRALLAAATALGCAAAWELYEFGADQIFLTYRHAGTLDTTYDLFFGALGSCVVAALLWWRETAAHRSPAPPVTHPVGYARLRTSLALEPRLMKADNVTRIRNPSCSVPEGLPSLSADFSRARGPVPASIRHVS